MHVSNWWKSWKKILSVACLNSLHRLKRKRIIIACRDFIPMNSLIPIVDFSQELSDVSGQIGKRSRRIYANDAKKFARWMIEQGLTVEGLTRSHIIAYRGYLDEHYAKATAARMLSVARRILGEHVYNGVLAGNPAKDVKGFTLDNESPHISLTKEQAKNLLAAIERSTPEGKREYALIYLLLRTGIRRSECVALNIGDFTRDQGHIVATVKHGKGDKRRKVKIPPEVFRALESYLEATGRDIASL